MCRPAGPSRGTWHRERRGNPGLLFPTPEAQHNSIEFPVPRHSSQRRPKAKVGATWPRAEPASALSPACPMLSAAVTTMATSGHALGSIKGPFPGVQDPQLAPASPQGSRDHQESSGRAPIRLPGSPCAPAGPAGPHLGSSLGHSCAELPRWPGASSACAAAESFASQEIITTA